MLLQDWLRAVALFEISAVITLSVFSLLFFAKRMMTPNHAETKLTWHVLLIAGAFLGVTTIAFRFVFERLGDPYIHPWLWETVVYYTMATVGMYLMWTRQIRYYKRGK